MMVLSVLALIVTMIFLPRLFTNKNKRTMHEIEFILLPKYNRSDFRYGYSTNQNATLNEITNWQDSPFFNMAEGTYVFYAKKKTGKKHFKRVWTVSCTACEIHLISLETINDCSIQTLKAYTPNLCMISTLKAYTPTTTTTCIISTLKAYNPPTTPPSYISFDGIVGINI